MIQAPNPNTIKPQAATGKRQEISSKQIHEVPPPFNPQQEKQQKQPELPHPIQQLANSYNSSSRPLPDIRYQQNQHNQTTVPPTIINNYYYVQPHSPMSPNISMQQLPQNSNRDQNQLQYHQPHITSQKNRHTSNSQNSRPQSDSYDNRNNLNLRKALSNKSIDLIKVASTASSLPANKNDDNDNVYDSFVKKSLTSSYKRSSPKKESMIDSLYGESSKTDIYSAASVISDDSRHRLYNSSCINDITAKIPNINIYPEHELSQKLEDLSFSNNNINIIDELIKLKDSDISVHNDQFFKLFDSCCVVSNSMNIEQLGSILYDPYHKNNRFSFKSLTIIMDTFVSKTSNDELDFRCFVRMCKFIKGCYISFNYHDKRGNDHVLDFNEFQKALKSNHIECSDFLLAKIFQKSEYIDLEEYILAIILIRKEEKKH
jgi:hypothetical protein